MANTSAIFKGAYTKLLTSLGLGLEAGQKLKYTDGAAAGAVPVSDASGILSLTTLSAGSVNTGLTQGSVPFIGASGVLAQDNAKLFFDNSNKRLGIGTATPTYTLDVLGTAEITDGTTASTVASVAYISSAASNRGLIIYGQPTGPSLLVDQSGANRSGTNSSAVSVESRGTTSASFATYYRNSAASVIMATRSDRRVGVGSADCDAQLDVTCSDATNIGQIIQGAAAQTADLQQWQSSASAVLASVCALGCAKFSGMVLGQRTVTSAPTITAADHTLFCNATSAAFSVTLPAAATSAGRILNIKKSTPLQTQLRLTVTLQRLLTVTRQGRFHLSTNVSRSSVTEAIGLSFKCRKAHAPFERAH